MGIPKIPFYSSDFTPRFPAIVRFPRMLNHIGWLNVGWMRSKENNATLNLLFAEKALQDACLAECLSNIEMASAWILRSASPEHVCLLHLVKSHCAMENRDYTQAGSLLEEGIHVAGQCGFRILHVDLLIANAKVHRLEGNLDLATSSAREAIEIASDRKCNYIWGIVEAADELFQTLVRLNRRNEAASVIRKSQKNRDTIEKLKKTLEIC